MQDTSPHTHDAVLEPRRILVTGSESWPLMRSVDDMLLLWHQASGQPQVQLVHDGTAPGLRAADVWSAAGFVVEAHPRLEPDAPRKHRRHLTETLLAQPIDQAFVFCNGHDLIVEARVADLAAAHIPLISIRMEQS